MAMSTQRSGPIESTYGLVSVQRSSVLRPSISATDKLQHRQKKFGGWDSASPKKQGSYVNGMGRSQGQDQSRKGASGVDSSSSIVPLSLRKQQSQQAHLRLRGRRDLPSKLILAGQPVGMPGYVLGHHRRGPSTIRPSQRDASELAGTPSRSVSKQPGQIPTFVVSAPSMPSRPRTPSRARKSTDHIRAPKEFKESESEAEQTEAIGPDGDGHAAVSTTEVISKPKDRPRTASRNVRTNRSSSDVNGGSSFTIAKSKKIGLPGVAGAKDKDRRASLPPNAGPQPRDRAAMIAARRSHSYMPSNKPTFYVSTGNGGEFLSSLLEGKGMERIEPGPVGRMKQNFKLKWCQRASDFRFEAFKEGKQLIGRNPCISCIGNKLKLRKTLTDYESKAQDLGVKHIPVSEIIPMTYELTNASERAIFEELADANPSWMWICKPTGLNCGQGIFVVDNVTEFRQKLSKEDAERSPGARVPTRIIQRYINNPMLLKKRKFDIRVYMLIASSKPLIGFYGGHGYCRLTIDEYEGADAKNKSAHLTNQAMQKKHPRYKEMVEDTTWSIDQMNTYLNENKMAPEDWSLNVLPGKIKAVMTQVLRSIDGRLDPRQGIFDFLGLDFLIDEDLNVWFIETNVNPALYRNSSVLDERITKAVTTALDIVLEVHEKQKEKKPVFPLDCDVGEFEVLVGGSYIL